MTPTEFKRQLDELEGVIKGGIAYFTVWSGLGQDEDAVRALNRYVGFRLSYNALVWMALMQLDKVFNRHRKAVSLRNLLIAAKKDRALLTPYATEDDLNQIEKQIDANQALLKRLGRVLNQLIAHHGAFPVGDKRLRYGEVRQLVEDIKAWCNSLRYGHNRNRFKFEDWCQQAERDTSEVVRVMREIGIGPSAK